MRAWTRAGVLALLAVIAGPAMAEDATTPVRSTESAGRLEAADRSFLDDAVQASLFAQEAGRLAGAKARRPEVRDHAQRLAEDQAAVGRQLAAIATSLGVSPTGLASPATRQRLQELEAAQDFDAAYVGTQLRAQRDAIAAFQRQAAQGRDPQLTSFAEQRLTALHGHLAGAEALDRHAPPDPDAGSSGGSGDAPAEIIVEP